MLSIDLGISGADGHNAARLFEVLELYVFITFDHKGDLKWIRQHRSEQVSEVLTIFADGSSCSGQVPLDLAKKLEDEQVLVSRDADSMLFE